MVFQPLSVGDVLMLSQTAWKIGRAFANGKNSAPAEFAEVERELNSLSEALKLVAEALHEDHSILSQAEDTTRGAVNTILESARKTLEDLESFVDRYQVIKKNDTGHGFVVERSWSNTVIANYKVFKWTTENSNIQELRNVLQMHVDCIDLTIQALQSRSLGQLEKTVLPMAENVASIHEKINGDMSKKLDDLHQVITSILRSTPSPEPRHRQLEHGRVWGGTSTSASSLSGSPPGERGHRLLEAPLPAAECPRLPPRRHRNSSISPAYLSATNSFTSVPKMPKAAMQQARLDDWIFESGSPPESQHSMSDGRDWCASPHDSAYAGESSSRASWRRDSATLPAHLRPVEEDYQVAAGSSRDAADVAEQYEGGVIPAPPVPLKSPRRRPLPPLRSVSEPQSPDLLPPPAITNIQEEQYQIATPSTVLAKVQRTRSNVVEHPPSSKSAAKFAHRQTVSSGTPSANESQKFEKQLFRNAAILCDVRGRLVEYAQHNPDIADPRYNVEMKEACKECKIYVIRKRENREHGGTKVATSVWCLSDDGEVRLQQKLSETQETVPYCSYFEPEKVSLQSTKEEEQVTLKFHAQEWAAMLNDEKKTNWVNYYFCDEADAVAFQSAVFGRTLLGSYRTTKTTVIHEGLKGAFAFEEQFANIEMLRLWEEDGVETPGAAGGVMALMHISSNFGEGWARWWINNSRQHLSIKEDGSKHARVKGIDVTVARPGATARQAERARSASLGVATSTRAAEKDTILKRVNGIRIEFKSEEERTKFVRVGREAQKKSLPLPEL